MCEKGKEGETLFRSLFDCTLPANHRFPQLLICWSIKSARMASKPASDEWRLKAWNTKFGFVHVLSNLAVGWRRYEACLPSTAAVWGSEYTVFEW